MIIDHQLSSAIIYGSVIVGMWRYIIAVGTIPALPSTLSRLNPGAKADAHVAICTKDFSGQVCSYGPTTHKSVRCSQPLYDIHEPRVTHTTTLTFPGATPLEKAI
jgi:hypothetical protein